MRLHLVSVLVLVLVTPALSLIGYDCTGRGLNITTLSLLNIGECNVEDIKPIREEAYIQLLQLSDFDKTQVKQCKVEIDRTIYYCGMHSHVSIVQNRKEDLPPGNWTTKLQQTSRNWSDDYRNGSHRPDKDQPHLST